MKKAKTATIWIIAILLISSVGYLYVKQKYEDTEGVLRIGNFIYPVYQYRKSGEVPSVTEYLKKNLNDWQSYEPVNWGMLTKKIITGKSGTSFEQQTVLELNDSAN